MKQTTKTALAVCLSLVVGFASGSVWKGVHDEKEAERTLANLPFPSAVAPRNELIALDVPGARHVFIDPTFIPTIEPVVATILPKMMSFMPKTKTVETDKDVRVIAKLPGLNEKEVDIAVAPDAVSIRGNLIGEGDRKQGNMIREEFNETIQLPVKVDAGRAQASYKDGELTVVLPKSGSAVAQRNNNNRKWQ